MKTVRMICVAAFLAALVIGCGKDDKNPTAPKEITIADLAGTWTATKMEYTNKANNSQKVDLVQLGVGMKLTINSSGRYTATLTISGLGELTTAGTITLQGGNLILDDDEEAENQTVAFTLSGNTLTLTGDDEFDFNDDGTDEPAAVVMVFQKS
jgi:hypothetical protein